MTTSEQAKAIVTTRFEADRTTPEQVVLFSADRADWVATCSPKYAAVLTAAPELYAALLTLCDDIEADYAERFPGQTIIANGRAALAKAEGR